MTTDPDWFFMRHEVATFAATAQRMEQLLRDEYRSKTELARAIAAVREKCRAAKLYDLADELRSALEANGFVVEDGIVDGQPMPPRVYRRG